MTKDLSPSDHVEEYTVYVGYDMPTPIDESPRIGGDRLFYDGFVPILESKLEARMGVERVPGERIFQLCPFRWSSRVGGVMIKDLVTSKAGEGFYPVTFREAYALSRGVIDRRWQFALAPDRSMALSQPLDQPVEVDLRGDTTFFGLGWVVEPKALFIRR